MTPRDVGISACDFCCCISLKKSSPICRCLSRKIGSEEKDICFCFPEKGPLFSQHPVGLL